MDVPNALTRNGMPTHASTDSPLLDLFASVSSFRALHRRRGLPVEEGEDIVDAQFDALLMPCLFAAPVDTLKLLMWARDVREGAGERYLFRHAMARLAGMLTDTAVVAILRHTPEFGRWDEVLPHVRSKRFGEVALDMIKYALVEEKDRLCAKWMPREASTTAWMRDVASRIRAHLGMSNREYRKLLVGLTHVVETPMCAGEWDTIEFGKVPSVAHKMYRSAFKRHAPSAYGEYVTALATGRAKVNAAALYPHDVLRMLEDGDASCDAVAEAAWRALPDYLGDGVRVLPMIDTSGSMTSEIPNLGGATCMDVAIAIGLYVAERAEGGLNHAYMTFSERATIERVPPAASLREKVDQIRGAAWAQNTNLMAAFEELLSAVTNAGCASNRMPTVILVISDMEFDECVNAPEDTALQGMRKLYANAGYELPGVVFWNVRARARNNCPVQMHESGTALVSGFSPAVLKAVLRHHRFTPMSVLRDILDNPRYDIFAPDETGRK